MTIGNDMSSRDIEGDNPLYLPQAKVYDACAGLGPWITLIQFMPTGEALKVHLEIFREGKLAFSGDSSAAMMARQFNDLVQWLGRDQSFPEGAFLMTGTGIVPDSPFTLQPGDEVRIDIAGIGRLTNRIIQD
jgi:2-dehydro-3-deoxy-D-arabinonate dehydratase